MVNFNAFVDCKALDAKNGVVFRWYAGEMSESPDVEKDPLVLDTIRAGVDLTCTKKGVQKPTYFIPIGETRESRIKIEKELEGKIVVCLACPIVDKGEPSISGILMSIFQNNNPKISRCYIETARFCWTRNLSISTAPETRNTASFLRRKERPFPCSILQYSLGWLGRNRLLERRPFPVLLGSVRVVEPQKSSVAR